MRVIGRDTMHIARPRTPQHHCHFSLSQEKQSEEEESTAAGPSVGRTGMGTRLRPKLQKPIGMGEGTAPNKKRKPQLVSLLRMPQLAMPPVPSPSRLRAPHV